MMHHRGASLSKQQTADLLLCHGTQQDLSLSTETCKSPCRKVALFKSLGVRFFYTIMRNRNEVSRKGQLTVTLAFTFLIASRIGRSVLVNHVALSARLHSSRNYSDNFL